MTKHKIGIIGDGNVGRATDDVVKVAGDALPGRMRGEAEEERRGRCP